MIVLADFHHCDLFYSLQLLFEKRLRYTLYAPIGIEWYEKGYWKVFEDKGTALQYLEAPLLGAELISPGIWRIPDIKKPGVSYHGIEFSKFIEMQFNIVLSSIPQHMSIMNELIAKYQPLAKHIFQCGNSWGWIGGMKNVLSSTIPYNVGDGVNICYYHQEFDSNELFSYSEPLYEKTIRSFIPNMASKMEMNFLSYSLQGWSFRSYGPGMEDVCTKTIDIATLIKSGAFVWHVKPEDDAYGHIFHNIFACGRPMLVRSSHYRNRLGSLLIRHMDNCIDLDQFGSLKQAANEINNVFLDRDFYVKMCKSARSTFDNNVNFNDEEIKIRKFIGALL